VLKLTTQNSKLFMGGQTRVFYGAAGFSRDIDLTILADGLIAWAKQQELRQSWR